MTRTMIRLMVLILAACGGAAPRPPVTALEPAAPAAAPAEPVPAELVFPEGPEEGFRGERPRADAPRAFQQPAIEHFELSNGIEVYLVERHELPTVTMDLTFEGGIAASPKGKEGLAQLCISLMTEGTDKLDKVAFSEALADMASHVGSWASREQQGVSMATLSRFLDPTLDLWVDTILRPGLRTADFDRKVAESLAGIKQQKGAPGSLGQRLAGNVLFGGDHPFGRIPTEASIQALSLDDCRAHIAATVKPQGAKLYIVGDVTPAQLRDKLDARLGAWKGKPRPMARIGKPRPTTSRMFFVDVPGAPQSQIYVMHMGPDRKAKDYFATTIMAGVLGGDFGSRINMNLREDKGWAYGAYGGFSYTRPLGFFAAAASVRSDATKGAVEELMKEIRTMVTGEVTDEELGREIKGAILSLPAQFATGQQTLGAFRELVTYGLPLDWYGSYVQNFQSVTKEGVMRAAKEHLKPDGAVVLVVGDGQKVLPGLQSLLPALGNSRLPNLIVLDADGREVTQAK